MPTGMPDDGTHCGVLPVYYTAADIVMDYKGWRDLCRSDESIPSEEEYEEESEMLLQTT